VSRVDAVRPLDLSSIVEKARLAFRRVGDRFEAGAPTHRSSTSSGRSSLQAVAASSSAKPPSAVTFEVTQLGRASSVRPPVHGATERLSDGSVATDLGTAREVARNRPEGLEQRWDFGERPAGEGDLIVRIGVHGQAWERATEHGLHFFDRETGYGTRYGVATWIDREGRRTKVVPAFEDDHIVLRVPAALLDESQFPSTLQPIISPEFGVDRPLPGDFWYRLPTRVALCGNVYLAVWADSERAASADDLRAARIDIATGSLLDPAGFLVAETTNLAVNGQPTGRRATSFAVTSNGREFIVVWDEVRDLARPSAANFYARRIRTDGTVLDGPVSKGGVLVAPADSVTPQAQIIAAGDYYYMTWGAGDAAGGYELRGLRLDGNTGAPVEAARSLGGLPGGAAVATDGKSVLVLSGLRFLRVRLSDGAVLDAPTPFASGDHGFTTAAFDGTNYVVVWDALGSLRSSRITPAGVVIDPPDASVPGGLLVCPNRYAQSPRLLVTGTLAVLLWIQSDTLYASRLDTTTGVLLDAPPSGACGVSLGLTYEYYQSSFYDAVISDQALFVVLNSTGARFNPAGMTPLGSTQVVGAINDSTDKVAVASNGSDFLVAWTEFRRTRLNGSLFAMRIAADGTLLDSEAIRLDESNQVGLSVAAASANGDYLVGWTRTAGRENVLCATRIRGNDGVTLDGTPSTCGALIDETSNQSSFGNVSVASDGEQYLLAWSELVTSPYRSTIFAQRFEPTVGLSADGGSPRMNVLTDEPSSTGSVRVAATRSAGSAHRNFLVTWVENLGLVRVALVPSTGGPPGPPVALTDPLLEVVNLRALSDGADFFLTWGQVPLLTPQHDAAAQVDYTPMVARLSGIDGATLQPTFALQTSHDIEHATLAFDGTHYWAIWPEADNDRYLGAKLIGTRLDRSGGFLDAAERAGAFEIGPVEWLRGRDMAANDAGRVLLAYSSFDHVSASHRIYARFLSDQPEERDAGVDSPDDASLDAMDAGHDVTDAKTDEPDARVGDSSVAGSAGSAGSATGGAGGQGGSARVDSGASRDSGAKQGGPALHPDDDGGCGCRTPRPESPISAWALLAGAAMFFWRSRRRAREKHSPWPR